MNIYTDPSIYASSFYAISKLRKNDLHPKLLFTKEKFEVTKKMVIKIIIFNIKTEECDTIENKKIIISGI